MLPVLPSRKIPRLLFALASGVLLALCFPNFSILPLLPVALIPLLAALDGLPWRRAFLPGFVFGTAFWVVSIPWIAYTVHRFGGVGTPLAGLALAITAALCSVPFGVMASLYAAVRPRTGAGVVAAFAAAWAVQEGFRTYIWIFGGFPWNLLANPLADVPALLGTTALGGAYLTSFLLAALNAALFVAWTRPSRNARLGWLLGAAIGAPRGGGRASRAAPALERGPEGRRRPAERRAGHPVGPRHRGAHPE